MCYRNKKLNKNVIVGLNTSIAKSAKLEGVILGDNVTIDENVTITNSFVFSNTKIEKDVTISLSIIGANCIIKPKSKILAGSILGKNVQIEEGTFIEDALVQYTQPSECK